MQLLLLIKAIRNTSGIESRVFLIFRTVVIYLLHIQAPKYRTLWYTSFSIVCSVLLIAFGLLYLPVVIWMRRSRKVRVQKVCSH